MQGFFTFTLFISVFILIAGLVKPSIFQKLLTVTPTKKFITLISLGGIIISFIGVGSSPSPIEENKNIQQRTIQTIPTTPLEVTTTPSKAISKTAQIKPTKPESPTPSPTKPPATQYTYYSISSVVDGDTVKVNINGTITTLRLIGMDTPETVDPRKPVQCFGKEASNKAKELLIGKKIRLEKDATQGELDKYGRTLAYIYREDGLFYNKHMIEQGYAHEYTYNTPYKYQAEFKAVERVAREAQRGLWSSTTCNGDTTASATATTAPTPVPESSNPTAQSSGSYYTSSHSSAKYYYPADCSGWKSLSPSYLKSFDSVAALLAKYPSRTLSPSCQ